MSNELIYKNEKEIQKSYTDYCKTWKDGMSRDGYITTAEGKFEYKKITYVIKIVKYFTMNDGFRAMGDRKSAEHCVLEFSDESVKLNNSLKILDKYSDFLWYDPLHSHNETQSLGEQIDECHMKAKNDIDKLPEIINNSLDAVFTLINAVED